MEATKDDSQTNEEREGKTREGGVKGCESTNEINKLVYVPSQQISRELFGPGRE